MLGYTTMTLRTVLILALMPLLAFAAADTITVIQPAPTTVTISSSTQPTVTINASGPDTLTLVVPGPQGPPGSTTVPNLSELGAVPTFSGDSSNLSAVISNQVGELFFKSEQYNDSGPNNISSIHLYSGAYIDLDGYTRVNGQPFHPITFSGDYNSLINIPPNGLRGYDGRPGINGFDGRPGAASLFCNISSGTRTINYDQSGFNPAPAMAPFRYVLYVGGQVVTALRQVWNTGVGVLSGTATTTSFTPAVSASYVAGNNYVQVFATYSASALLGGKRTCTTGTPVAVTRTGATGAQGEPGQSVSVTEQAVVHAMMTGPASDDPFVLQAATGTRTKLDIRDTTGATRLSVDSNGQMQAISAVPKLVTATTSGPTYSIDTRSSTAYLLTLNGAVTFSATTPYRSQESFTLILKQGSVGSYAWPANFKWGPVSAPTMTATTGAQDLISCLTADGGISWLCQYALGY
jgi:hypothetical protein